ncbi:hypothetical protein [Kaistella daneshvariae]|nr:hypothetical protein [Kaistella daneshvariae]
MIGGISLAVFYYVTPQIAEQKKLPNINTQPIMGLKSDNVGFIEKFGYAKSNDSIILIGDSHALMLKPFVDKVGLEN